MIPPSAVGFGTDCGMLLVAAGMISMDIATLLVYVDVGQVKVCWPKNFDLVI